MAAFFVTGAGTDIGKTWVSAALLRHWRSLGLQPDALKPVATGYDPARPEDSDGAALLAALGRPIDAALRAETARRIAKLRAGAEAREGVSAFLEKRKPRWPD